MPKGRRLLALLAGLALSQAPALAATDPAPDEVQVSIDPEGTAGEASALLAARPPVPEAIRLLALRALALSRLSRWEAAEADLSRAFSLLPAGAEALRAELLFTRSLVQADRLDFVAALDTAGQARALMQRAHGPDDPRTLGAAASWAMSAMALGRTADALPVLAHGWQVLSALRPAGDAERAELGLYYATALSRSRRSEEAEGLLRQLVGESALLPEGHAMRAKVRISMGAELVSQGRLRDALPILREGVDLGAASKGLLAGERANAMGVLGSALLQFDRPEDAAPYIDAAAELFGHAGRPSLQASALILAGGAADRSGDRAKGLTLRQRALAAYRALPNGGELGVALSQFKLAQSLAVAGQLAEAELAAADAAEVLARLRAPTHYQVTNSAISLGWIRVLRGDAAQGLPLVRDNFRLSVATNERLEVAKNQVVGVLDNVEAYSQALDAALRGGDRDFAFEVLQVMAESDASRAAVAVAAREGAADSALGKLLRERQEAASALVDAEAALTRALALEATTKSETARLRGEREAREAALAALDARLDHEVPAFRTLLRPRRLSLAEAQARLGRDEVLLVAVEGDLGLVTMALTARAVAVGRADLRRHQVRALVRRIRAGIDAGEAATFDMEAARALHDALFTPEVRALVRPGTRLRLATGDILSALPLSLLASAPGRFLIEDHALSVVPSIAAMGGAQGARRGGGRLAAIGAPDLGGGAAGVPSRSSALVALPGALREIEAVARQLRGYGAPLVLTGSAATEAALRAADLSQFDVLLFATHGLVAGAFDAHSEPALVLAAGGGEGSGADGLLSASEAARLDLRADWVILSACDTAAGDQPSAAGYTGLARAFLFAGARRVVASHWPVRDDISARVSLGIVRGVKRSRQPDEALRAAILGVMRDRTLADARNPALWAPFMVVAR